MQFLRASPGHALGGHYIALSYTSSEIVVWSATPRRFSNDRGVVSPRSGRLRPRTKGFSHAREHDINQDEGVEDEGHRDILPGC
jgi:hypothetical protein